jgi:hypothetical protein
MAEIDRELIFTHYANDSPVGEKRMKMFIRMSCWEVQHALTVHLLMWRNRHCCIFCFAHCQSIFRSKRGFTQCGFNDTKSISVRGLIAINRSCVTQENRIHLAVRVSWLKIILFEKYNIYFQVKLKSIRNCYSMLSCLNNTDRYTTATGCTAPYQHQGHGAETFRHRLT